MYFLNYAILCYITLKFFKEEYISLISFEAKPRLISNKYPTRNKIFNKIEYQVRYLFNRILNRVKNQYDIGLAQFIRQ